MNCVKPKTIKLGCVRFARPQIDGVCFVLLGFRPQTLAVGCGGQAISPTFGLNGGPGLSNSGHCSRLDFGRHWPGVVQISPASSGSGGVAALAACRRKRGEKLVREESANIGPESTTHFSISAKIGPSSTNIGPALANTSPDWPAHAQISASTGQVSSRVPPLARRADGYVATSALCVGRKFSAPCASAAPANLLLPFRSAL